MVTALLQRQGAGELRSDEQLPPRSVVEQVTCGWLRGGNEAYRAHLLDYSYHPLPVVFERALGAHVWDPEVS